MTMEPAIQYNRERDEPYKKLKEDKQRKPEDSTPYTFDGCIQLLSNLLVFLNYIIIPFDNWIISTDLMKNILSDSAPISSIGHIILLWTLPPLAFAVASQLSTKPTSKLPYLSPIQAALLSLVVLLVVAIETAATYHYQITADSRWIGTSLTVLACLAGITTATITTRCAEVNTPFFTSHPTRDHLALLVFLALKIYVSSLALGKLGLGASYVFFTHLDPGSWLTLVGCRLAFDPFTRHYLRVNSSSPVYIVLSKHSRSRLCIQRAQETMPKPQEGEVILAGDWKLFCILWSVATVPYAIWTVVRDWVMHLYQAAPLVAQLVTKVENGQGYQAWWMLVSVLTTKWWDIMFDVVPLLWIWPCVSVLSGMFWAWRRRSAAKARGQEV